MSINIDSNKTTTFGQSLPTPYLDKVEVYDEEIKVFASMYFEFPEVVNHTAFVDYVNTTVSSIKVVSTILPRTEQNITDPSDDFVKTYSNFVNNNSLDAVAALKNKDAVALDIFNMQYKFLQQDEQKLYITYPSTDDFGDSIIPLTAFKVYESDLTETGESLILFLRPTSDIENIEPDSEQIIYDSKGNKVLRIQFEASFFIGSGPNFIDGITPRIIQSFEYPAEAAYKAIDIILFSTSLEIDNEFDIPEKYSPLSSMAPVYSNAISDIVYEQIGTEGVLRAANEIIYKAQNGDVYRGDKPIQSIDFLYYGTTPLTNTEIVKNFKSIIGTSTDAAVQDAYDNINYILETSGQKTDILIRLNEYRKTFPNTSTAVPVGRLYEVFERTLYNINNAVKRGTLLLKEINTNPIIRDLRTPETFTLDPSTEPDNKIKAIDVDEYIYLDTSRSDTADRYPTYGAYSDPSSIAHTTSDFNVSLFAGLDEFSDVQNSVQVHKRVRALSFQLEDIRKEIQSFAESLIIDRDASAGNPLDMSGEWPQWISGVIPFGDLRTFKVDGESASATYKAANLGFFLKKLSNRQTIRQMLDKYYEKNTFESLTEEALERGMTEGSDEFNNFVQLNYGLYTETKPGGGPHGGAAKAYEGVFRGDDELAGYYNGFQNRSKLTFYDGDGGNGIVLRFSDYINYYDSDYAIARNDQIISFTPDQVEQMKFLVNEYKIMKNTINQANAILDALEIEPAHYDEANHYVFGYWFFDYQKSLRNNSILSHAFNISKIESLFGKKFIQDRFRISQTDIQRWIFSSLAPVFSLPQTYEPLADVIIAPASPASYKASTLKTFHADIEHPGASFVIVVEGIPDEGLYPTIGFEGAKNTEIFVEQGTPAMPWYLEGQDVAQNNSVEYSYNIQRSFNTPGDKKGGGPFKIEPQTTLMGYRLVCFEHQEVFKGVLETPRGAFTSDLGKSYYKYGVFVMDRTGQIYAELVSQYKEYFDGDFTDYYNSALDQCNYNNTDQRFNKFFIDAAKETYTGIIETAPWYMMPVIYHTHLDLLFNLYKGDFSLITIAAKLETEKISPESGTLESLEQFRDKVANLFESYYSAEGIINTRLYDIFVGSPPDKSEFLQFLKDGAYNDLRYGVLNPVSGDKEAVLYNIPDLINLESAISYEEPESPSMEAPTEDDIRVSVPPGSKILDFVAPEGGEETTKSVLDIFPASFSEDVEVSTGAVSDDKGAGIDLDRTD